MPNNDQLNIDAAYSIFEILQEGEGNLSTDPLFININNNYQLNDNSPCIDAGVDYFIFNDGVFVNVDEYEGLSPDIGAYEFSLEVDTCDSLLGDVNLDLVLDILDILQTINFIMGFTNPTLEQFCIADMNQNNIIDILDIIIMVNSVLSFE